MSRRRSTTLLPALALLFMAACGGSDEGPADDSGPVRAALVHDIPDGHPRLPYFDEFAETVASASSGSIALRINPQDEVMEGPESLAAVQDGSVAVAAVNMAHVEALESAAGFMNLPFGLDDPTMTDADTRAAVVNLLGEQVHPHGLVLLGVMRGADQLFASPEPDDLRTFEDLDGKRIRVAGSGIYEQILSALRADPLPIAIPNLAQAVTTGELDGVFTSPGGWSTAVQQDAPHGLHAPGLMMITYAVVTSETWLAGLTPVQRHAVEQAGQAMTDHWVDMQHDDTRVIEDVVAGGGTYTRVPPAALGRWKSAVAPVTDRFLRRHQDVAHRLRELGIFGERPAR